MAKINGNSFVHQTQACVLLTRRTDDPSKAEQWDSCNNLVILWIMNSVSEAIS